MSIVSRTGAQLIWIVPSGGRDRPDTLTGEWYPVSSFALYTVTLECLSFFTFRSHKWLFQEARMSFGNLS